MKWIVVSLLILSAALIADGGAKHPKSHSSGAYLEVDDCSWHQGTNPRELSRSEWNDRDGKDGPPKPWSREGCSKHVPYASREYVEWCERNAGGNSAQCIVGTEQNSPRDVLLTSEDGKKHCVRFQ